MKNFRHFTLMLLCLLFPALAGAQSGNYDYSEIVPGFLGHPLLKSTGYQAVQGAFDLEIAGNGELGALDNVVDGDPDNAARTTNLVGATVAFDEIIRVVPDATTGIAAKPLEEGTKVGFVLASGSDDVNVLELDVIKMMAINFLDKDGKIIHSAISQGDDNLNILSLNLVSVAGGKQKVVAEIPENLTYQTKQGEHEAGSPGVAYGISLSTAGVDVNVGHEVKVYYAFIDDFERVPIIRKYYPHATGSVAGMVWTGGNTLVNNDLKDGVTLAVLNIGGVYCTVKTNEPRPFPHGVEAGWVMTSGTVLDLSAGAALQLFGIDKDGNEILLNTDVNVIGLDLIGGGETAVTFMTPTDVDLYGFKLKRIGVLELNLGALLINYAYIKIPRSMMEFATLTFDAGFEVVPFSQTLNGDNDVKPGDGVYKGVIEDERHIENKYNNHIYFSNNGERPLYAPDADYYQNNNITTPWVENTYKWSSLNTTAKGIRLVVTRKPIYLDADGEETVLHWYDVFKTGDKTNYFKSNSYYWGRDANPSGANTGGGAWNKFTPGDDVLDLSALNGREDPKEDTYPIYAKADVADAKNIVGYEYKLYSVNPKDDIEKEKPLVGGEELDYSVVTIPNFVPEWEIAGPVMTINRAENTMTTVEGTAYNDHTTDATDGPLANDVVDQYRHYVSWTVPDKIDEKVEVDKITLYRYKMETVWIVVVPTDVLTREIVQVYNRKTDASGKTIGWERERDGYYLADVYLYDEDSKDGYTKLVFDITEPNPDYWYGLEMNLKLIDDYVDDLVTEFGGNRDTYNIVNGNPREIDYGWFWTKGGNYTLPQLTASDPTTTNDNSTANIKSDWMLNFNVNGNVSESRFVHLAQQRSEQSGQVDNVDILYNQWSTIINPVSVGRQQSVQRRAQEENSIVTQNWVFNTDNTADYDYIANSQTDISEITQYVNGNYTHMLSAEVQYDVNMISQDMTNPTTFNVVTRAYVPVVPYGFEADGLSEDVQTYLVAEEQKTAQLNVTTSLEPVVNPDATYEYFTVDGIKVAKPESGIYIRRGSDGTVAKILVK